MTTNYRYHRFRSREVPVQKYICTNCCNEFEYNRFAVHNTANHFCCNECKSQWYYFMNQMSVRQLNILSHLIENNGRAVMPQSASIDSMVFKPAPLLEPLGCKDGLIEVRITERGLYWHSLKRNVLP